MHSSNWNNQSILHFTLVSKCGELLSTNQFKFAQLIINIYWPFVALYSHISHPLDNVETRATVFADFYFDQADRERNKRTHVATDWQWDGDAGISVNGPVSVVGYRRAAAVASRIVCVGADKPVQFMPKTRSSPMWHTNTSTPDIHTIAQHLMSLPPTARLDWAFGWVLCDSTFQGNCF